MITLQPDKKRESPEDISRASAGEPYPEKKPLNSEFGNDTPHLPFPPNIEPSTPQDSELERAVKPEPLDT